MRRFACVWGRIGCGVVLLLLVAGCASPRPPRPAEVPPSMAALRAALAEGLRPCTRPGCAVEIAAGVRVDTVVVDAAGVDVRFNSVLLHRPLRPAGVDTLAARVRQRLAPWFSGRAVRLTVAGQPVATFVPNYYRASADRDAARLARPAVRPAPLVRRLDAPWQPTAGLQGRYLAVWASHGWYYEPTLDRWEWQRARLFQAVEDLIPLSFTQPYLVPMLERAGATVLQPRERDLQPREVVVDADSPASGYAEGGPWDDGGTGFAHRPPYGDGVNPFALGSHRTTAAGTGDLRTASWTPAIPETGEYAVYVSYVAAPDRTTEAVYTVHHAGGAARFAVNQQIGGGTWLYLGTFRFRAGTAGYVTLSSSPHTSGATLSADAVRFGGGRGEVVRGGATSGRPRFVEAARYSLQGAGAPPHVYNVTGRPDDDYRDDFQSRGEWVNWLRAAPTGGDGFGPVGHRDAPGLGLPLDATLAFHTDAGISPSDTTIGTLLIYRSQGLDTTATFPDGVSRQANRDLADLVQSQLVDDLRALYDPAWTRRALWDRGYSEATRPNVPAALLELLSQQNFVDMRFAKDPRFRFDVSRALYKALLRFIATQHGTPYVVQPLPVARFQALLDGTDGVALRWTPTPDPLEPTATPDAYLVYTRLEDGGWDAGRLVATPEVRFDGLRPGIVYSYRVSAVNAGGESAPSEVLAVMHRPDGGAPVLVVNGFDRVAPPAALDTDSLAGFADFWDAGVPDGYDLGHTGVQYEFRRTEAWRNDDDPGHGASYGDQEGRPVLGNTFDYPYRHGVALRAAGRGFASTSAAALAAGEVATEPYRVLDLILGEQRTTPWPKPVRPPQFAALPAPLRDALGTFCTGGGGLLISGAYVGTDVFAAADTTGRAFLRDVLGVRWRTHHAATTGAVQATRAGLFPPGFTTRFATATDADADIYPVEAPDALEPADTLGQTVLRYAENSVSAGVARRGPSCAAVVLGFPFEALREADDRATVMQAVLGFLVGKGDP